MSPLRRSPSLDPRPHIRADASAPRRGLRPPACPLRACGRPPLWQPLRACAATSHRRPLRACGRPLPGAAPGRRTRSGSGRPLQPRALLCAGRHSRANAARGLPPVLSRRSRYYFSGGVWYAPRGPSFVVVTPPVGIAITVLPPYYSTVWLGGVPTITPTMSTTPRNRIKTAIWWHAPPPMAADPAASDATATAASNQYAAGNQYGAGNQSDFIIYPKNGQSKDQQAADEYNATIRPGAKPASIPRSRRRRRRAADADRES